MAPLPSHYVLYNDGTTRDCYALQVSVASPDDPDLLNLLYCDADGDWHYVDDVRKLELANYGEADGNGTWHSTFV